MTTKLLLKVSLLSLIFCVNGQFKHFPVQAGRPDSPSNVRQQQQPARPRPVPVQVDEQENEVIPAPLNRNRGRGRARGTQNTAQETPQRAQRVQEPSQRAQRIQESSQRAQRVQETPQRPLRGRVPERIREVQQTTNLRVETSRVPERRPDPRSNQANIPAPAVETKQRQRIRIRPKPTEAPQAAPPSTPRARQRTQEPQPAVSVTTQKPTPVTTNDASKQTFGQSLSGIFDPSQLTVFGDNRVSPVRQETPQQQFRMPEIPKIRTLTGPKIVSRPAPAAAVDIRQDIDQGFLPVQELVREEPARAVPVSAPQKPVQQVQPFTHFQQQPAQPRPIPFQTQPQPAVPQQLNRQLQPDVPQQLNRQPQPSVPQQQPQPSFATQQLSRQPQPAVPQQLSRLPQPAVPQQLTRQQAQPEIRQPQPIPFQTRPKTPRQLVPQRQKFQPAPSSAPQQQASSDFFKDSLFSQPIEIPSNANGASFSYEAILG